MSSNLSPRYGHVVWSADTLIWHLSIDYNMDLQYQIAYMYAMHKLTSMGTVLCDVLVVVRTSRP